MKVSRIAVLVLALLFVGIPAIAGTLVGLGVPAQHLGWITLLGAGLVGMAITATPVQTDNNYKSWNITALEADTTTSFTHGFGVAPDFFFIQSALANGGASATTAVDTWGMTVNATNVTLTKLSLTGSGGASPGTSVVAKVWALRPNSHIR